jgi:NAD(P)-dependent dehydrogenase (short-subunit alcohol dehydrogenase family)
MKLMQDKVVIIAGAGCEKGQRQAAALKIADQGAEVVVTNYR